VIALKAALTPARSAALPQLFRDQESWRWLHQPTHQLEHLANHLPARRIFSISCDDFNTTATEQTSVVSVGCQYSGAGTGLADN